VREPIKPNEIWLAGRSHDWKFNVTYRLIMRIEGEGNDYYVVQRLEDDLVVQEVKDRDRDKVEWIYNRWST
jgi:hypothetical protein